MSAMLNSLNAHYFFFQPILMTLVYTCIFMVYRALSDKTYLLSELRSPLIIIKYSPYLFFLL